MKGLRGARLDSEYQKAIYEIITTKIKDVDITEMVSILRCEVAPDLKHANVYVSVFSGSEEKRINTFNAIDRNAKNIRHELSKIMIMRTVPELHFKLDSSMDYSDKINKILHEINK